MEEKGGGLRLAQHEGLFLSCHPGSAAKIRQLWGLGGQVPAMEEKEEELRQAQKEVEAARHQAEMRAGELEAWERSLKLQDQHLLEARQVRQN